MDLELFRKILEIESTSGTERCLAEFLEKKFPETDPLCRCKYHEVGDGTLNLMFTWGDAMPEVVLCSHLDTVPPYIAPSFADIKTGDLLPDGKKAEKDDILIRGRGSCDAKGQIFAMWTACHELAAECNTAKQASGLSFGLLLLSGEETGSYGAKAYTRDCPGGEWLIVGEPTDNLMISAAKGTKAFNVTILGTPCHSGYPELGHSAVDIFIDFMNWLKAVEFPVDVLLGATTWNVGRLKSDNPQNVLSPALSFRLYFRTTFTSDGMVQELMSAVKRSGIPGVPAGAVEIEELGGDSPMKYDTFEGYQTRPAAFGSDTPRMTRFRHRSLCGPGSILVAHTDKEYVLASDIEKAKEQYKDMLMRALRFCRAELPGQDADEDDTKTRGIS